MRNQIFYNNKFMQTKEYSLLLITDYYQVAMAGVYILENRANEEVVFESFVRGIRESVAEDGKCYYFGGREKVIRYLEEIKNDLLLFPDKVLEQFLSILLPNIKEEIRFSTEKIIKEKWDSLNKTFNFSVAQDNGIVKPYVPVFQYKGARWIGQLIETAVLNIIDGATGYNTLLRNSSMTPSEKNYFRHLTFNEDDIAVLNNVELEDYINSLSAYEKALKKRSLEYRNITDFPIVEAGFKRTAGRSAAITASLTALENGWNGTSNTALLLIDDKYKDKIGGSCAHSFIMAYQDETEAFAVWSKYFLSTTLLIDTYDVINAAHNLSNLQLSPDFVRIDSEPLDKYALECSNIFKKNNLKTKIFLSSDITPEMIDSFNKNNIPYDKIMAGTKYVNCGMAEKINCGFVYKLVVNNIDGLPLFPAKKSTGKNSLPGYKKVLFDDNKIKIIQTKGEIGIVDIDKADSDSEVIFI